MSDHHPKEIANLARVEEAISSCVDQGRTLTLNLALSLHGILLEGVPEEPGEPNKPGELRGPAEKVRVNEAKHFEQQLPDAWRLRLELTSLFEAVENQQLPFGGMHAVGCFHYRFVRLHPFCDGNGRMARALSILLLAREDPEVFALEKPVNSVLLDHREDYIATLEYCDYIYHDLREEDLTEEERLSLCEVPFAFFYSNAVLWAYDEHLRKKGRKLYEAGAVNVKPLEPMDIDMSVAEMKSLHPWSEDIKKGNVELVKSERTPE